MVSLKNKNQLDATYYFIVLLIGSTCLRPYYAHHQKLATIMLITTLVVSFCKNGGSSVNVKVWFLVVYVQCEVLCRLVVAGSGWKSKLQFYMIKCKYIFSLHDKLQNYLRTCKE